MKTHIPETVLLAVAMTLFIAGASSSLVSAQVPSPCTATLSVPGVPVQYSNPNAPFVVPVFASCANYYGSQLYATGSAYDVTSNTLMGSASGLMSSVNGGTQFNGQLAFNRPPTSPGDSVQVSVSIYDSQGGNLLATTGATIPAGAGLPQPVQPVQPTQQITTTTVTVSQYPYPNPYPAVYPSTYPTNPSPSPLYQQQPQALPSTYNYGQGYASRWNNNNDFFNYVAIITIIAAVIIATTGLVLVARRQTPKPTYWYPVQRPPAR